MKTSLVLALSLFSSASFAALSNQNCCSTANDPTTCSALPATHSCPAGASSCSFDNCVGGTGVDCEGVQQSINLEPVGTITVDLVKPTPKPNGQVELKTSVGSILHDLCCIEHPHGAFCHSSNYPIGATLNLLGNANQECACLLEWRKAAWNLLRGRYWYHTFDAGIRSSDLTSDASVQRKSYLPTGSGTNYLSYKSTWGLTERKATSQLCAPSGTKLDCPNEDRNCEVPCFGLTCTACNGGCSRSQNKRWNKDGRDHANAGDSDYCCSGEFKKVYWAPSTRYGVCK